jgi:hypothetical protein
MITSPTAKYIKLAGNRSAGLLLQQLAFWEPKAGPCITFFREELSEQTGLPLRTLDRALAHLRRENLIDSYVSLTGKPAKTKLHIRLSARAKGLIPGCQNGSSTTCQNGSSLYIESSIESLKDTTSGQLLKQQTTETDSSEEEAEKEDEVKVADIVKAQKAQKAHHKPDNVLGLSRVWKETLAEADPGIKFIVLSKKQLGQLKHIFNKCPPGKAAAVVRWSLHNWADFTEEVGYTANKKIALYTPDIGFLLQYLEIAINLTLASEEKSANKKQEASATNEVQLIAQTLEPQPEADAKPKTKAELHAILYGEDDDD